MKGLNVHYETAFIPYISGTPPKKNKFPSTFWFLLIILTDYILLKIKWKFLICFKQYIDVYNPYRL